MQIGACGLACEVCNYLTRGVCDGCVAGNDEGAAMKLETQKKQFGFSCPLLACNFSRKVGYCPKDCAEFPCDLLPGDFLIVRYS